MKRIIIFVLTLILILGLCGCSNPSASQETESASASTELTATNTPVEIPAETPDVSTAISSSSATESGDGLAGRIDGNQYINDLLGFTATIPEGWVFATDDEIASIYGQAKGMMEGVTELPANSQGYLMICSQYQLQSAASNPNINLMVSNLYGELSESTYPDLLAQFQSLYETLYTQQMGADSVEVSGAASVEINGKDYMYFSIVSQFDSATMYQMQYLLPTDDGYVITFTLTYYQPEEKATMDAFMQGIAYTSNPA